MKSVDKLAKGDYIAFGFNYNGGEPNEIIVDNITEIYEHKVLVHFLYGHHSLSEFIKKEDILAIGNSQGKGVIKGCTGTYDILESKKISEILAKDKYK
ncbi:MAG TPA: hypothetical protein PK357_00515 [Candidatus Pacearchaeota archaeon]|nr:hypothetical protein [Candidatus Pacearchaeota archaeon]